MKILEHFKRINPATLGFLALLWVFFAIINYLSPPQNDDWLYWLLAKDTNALNNAVQSFLHNNGRLGEFIYFSVFVPRGAMFFDIINAFVCVGFFVAFFALLFGKMPSNATHFALLLLSVALCGIFMRFEETFLWQDGALNYVWMMTICALAMLPYRAFWGDYYARESHKARESVKDSAKDSAKIAKKSAKNPAHNSAKSRKSRTDSSDSFAKIAIIFALCVLAGDSNEIFSVILIIAHICLLLWAKSRKIPLPKWYIAGIVGLIVGFLVLYLSPGHSLRAEKSMLYNMDAKSIPLKDLLSLGFMPLCARILNNLSASTQKIPLIFALFGFIVAFYYAFWRVAGRNLIGRVIFVLGILIFAVFNVALPLGGILVILGAFIYIAYKDKSVIFALCAALLALSLLASLSLIQFDIVSDRAYSMQRWLIVGIMMILVYQMRRFWRVWGILSLAYLAFMLWGYGDLRAKYDTLTDYIEAQKALALESAPLEPASVDVGIRTRTYLAAPVDIVYPKEKFSFTFPQLSPWWNLSDDSGTARNAAWAWYFGVRSIALK